MKKQNQIHNKIPRRGDNMKHKILAAIQALMQPNNEKSFLSKDNKSRIITLEDIVRKEQVDELAEIVIKDLYIEEDFAVEVKSTIASIPKLVRFKATFPLWKDYAEEKENAWFAAAKAKCVAVLAALWAEKLWQSHEIIIDYQKINCKERKFNSYYETKKVWENLAKEGLSWVQDIAEELTEKIAKNKDTTKREKQLQDFINNHIHPSPYKA